MNAHKLRIWIVAIILLANFDQSNAADYQLSISVGSEDNLIDLQEQGELTDTDFAVLLDLYTFRVDLNTAIVEDLLNLPRINKDTAEELIRYRHQNKKIESINQLVAAGILTEGEADAIQAFIDFKSEKIGHRLHGNLRYQTQWVTSDRQLPAMALQATLHLPGNIPGNIRTAATVLLKRHTLGSIAYDPFRDALSAAPPAPAGVVPKYYITWHKNNLQLLVGTYLAGFGQGLTFDNTSRRYPNGFVPDNTVSMSRDLKSKCSESAGELEISPCNGAVDNQYIGPDFSSDAKLRGAAIRWQRPAIWGTMTFSVFGSFHSDSLNQSAVYTSDTCPDPRDNDAISCDSPLLFHRQSDPLLPSSTYRSASLRDIVYQGIGGAHIRIDTFKKVSVGFTGWGAKPNWRLQGLELDFQEWAKTPYGGAYGAAGIDLSFSILNMRSDIEVARSFDAMSNQDGGGFGTVAIQTINWDSHRLEMTLRRYETSFANPFASPVAAADEFEGNRARNEQGIRLQHFFLSHFAERHAFKLNTSADFWQKLTTGALEFQSFINTSYQTGVDWEPGLRLDYGSNQTIRAKPYVNFHPAQTLNVSFWVQHEWEQSNDLTRMLQNSSSALATTWHAAKKVTIRGRIRHQFDDIFDNEHLEQSLYSYLTTTFHLRKHLNCGLRYDNRLWLDKRQATTSRIPNPEHWLRIDLTADF